MAVKKWNVITSWDRVPQVIGVQELMVLLRISRQTALKYLNEGIIPAAKIGDKWLIDKDALKAVLAGGRETERRTA